MSVEIEPGCRFDFIWKDTADTQIVVTLQGLTTRFTYRVDKSTPAKNTTKRLVHALNGPDNAKDYRFLGAIYPLSGYYRSQRSPIGPEAACAQAFEWFWRNAESAQVVVLLSRPCGRCGRILTTTQSIRRGLGPECAKQVA